MQNERASRQKDRLGLIYFLLVVELDTRKGVPCVVFESVFISLLYHWYMV